MPETKLEKMNEQLSNLNANIETLNLNLEEMFKRFTAAPDLSQNEYAKAKAKVAEPDPVEEAPVEEPKKKRASKKKAEAPVEEPTEETVSIDDLQRFVLNLVREKRHLRDQIKDLVQEITGAKFMHDVPADKAGELKAAIENLANE